MKTQRIVEHPHLVRDMNTQAILNTDQLSVRRHEKRIADLQREEAREIDIDQMKNELREIKALLLQLSNSSISN